MAAMSEAIIETQRSQLEKIATKTDLKEFELKIITQLLHLKWMMGFILAGVFSPILKAFFIS